MTKEGALARLEELGTLLETALHILRDTDPLHRRLIDVFDQMPPQDRPVVLSILEREVSFRTAVLDEAGLLTGYGARVNPGARLYLRSFERIPAADQLPLTHDELVFSSLRSARLMQATLLPAIHDRWRAATLEAFRQLRADERERTAQVLRELLELILASANDAAPDTTTGPR